MAQSIKYLPIGQVHKKLAEPWSGVPQPGEVQGGKASGTDYRSLANPETKGYRGSFNRSFLPCRVLGHNSGQDKLDLCPLGI